MFQIKVAEEIKTHILCSATLYKNCTFYEIMWKNIVQPGRLQMIQWYIRIACMLNT